MQLMHQHQYWRFRFLVLVLWSGNKGVQWNKFVYSNEVAVLIIFNLYPVYQLPNAPIKSGFKICQALLLNDQLIQFLCLACQLQMDCFNILDNMLRMWNLVEDQTDLHLDKDSRALQFPETNYVSQFRINGKPILPPLVIITFLLSICFIFPFSLLMLYVLCNN